MMDDHYYFFGYPPLDFLTYKHTEIYYNFIQFTLYSSLSSDGKKNWGCLVLECVDVNVGCGGCCC